MMQQLLSWKHLWRFGDLEPLAESWERPPGVQNHWETAEPLDLRIRIKYPDRSVLYIYIHSILCVYF